MIYMKRKTMYKLFLVGLLLISSTAFAQKAAVLQVLKKYNALNQNMLPMAIEK